MQELPISKIMLYRGYNDHVAKVLANNIKELGVIDPITVRPACRKGYYFLLDGLHRIKACEILGIKKIRARVLPWSDSEKSRLFDKEVT